MWLPHCNALWCQSIITIRLGVPIYIKLQKKIRFDGNCNLPNWIVIIDCRRHHSYRSVVQRPYICIMHESHTREVKSRFTAAWIWYWFLLYIGWFWHGWSWWLLLPARSQILLQSCCWEASVFVVLFVFGCICVWLSLYLCLVVFVFVFGCALAITWQWPIRSGPSSSSNLLLRWTPAVMGQLL